MSEWVAKRFWTTVSVVGDEDGLSIRLDDRPVRTPAKRPLIVPTRTVAERIAAEWEAQEDELQPATMPWTRSANAAIDKVATQRREVMEHLTGYAGTDLLCYRAEGPEALVARQNEMWDPILDWVSDRFNARLETTRGVMPIDQAPDTLTRLARTMDPMSDFQLTGFHDMVTLSGSFAVGLAAAQGHASATDLWSASLLDENWQIEQWGEDDEAARAAGRKMAGFIHATELFSASDE